MFPAQPGFQFSKDFALGLEERSLLRPAEDDVPVGVVKDRTPKRVVRVLFFRFHGLW